MRSLLSLILCITTIYLTSAQEKTPFIDIGKISLDAIESAKIGDFEKALEILNRVNKNDSSYCDILISKSYYLLNSKKYIEAIAITNEGLNLDCHNYNSSYYINQGLAYYYLKEYDSALNTFNQAIKIYPKNYSLWYNKGLALEKLGKTKQAIQAYQEAITLRPTFANPHLQLGNLCYKQERLTQALMCYNIYLLLNYDSENAFNTLKSLNNIVAERNENKANPDLQLSPDDNAFDNLDLILSNKIALNKKYQTGNKIDIALTRQNHAMMEQLKDFEGNGGFWDKKYFPLFKWISDSNLFNDFIYTISYSIQNEKYAKIIKQNEKSINSFTNLFYRKWYDLLSTNLTEFDGKKQNVTYTYSDYDAQGMGIMENETNVGNWHYFTKDGQIMAHGKYNSSGKRTETWTWYYKNGNIKEIAHYKNGELNGKNESFHNNGKINYIANYAKNELDGEYLLYNERGALIQKKHFTNGELDGEYKSYFKVGEPLLEWYIPYRNGKVQSTAIEYYSNGDIYAEIPFQNGKRHGIEKKYNFNNNILAEISYKEGELNGPYKTYHPNGNILEEGDCLDNFYNSPWKTYYRNGVLESEFTYNKGYIDGKYRHYDTDGKLYYEYVYRKGEVLEYKYYNKNGNVISEGKKKGGEFHFQGHYPNGNISSNGLYDIKGGKEGLWQFYSENGILNNKGEYSNNKAYGDHINYYNNGNTESISHYENDTLSGYYSHYYKNGQLKRQGWYKNNNTHGEWCSYYSNGTLKEKNFYHKGKLHGTQELYGCEGKLDRVYNYKYGELIYEKYYDVDGNILGEVDYQTNKNNFKIIFKYKNGQKNIELEYLNGIKHGKYIGYDYYGKKNVEGNYRNGEQNGTWVWYYEDGKKECIANYRNGTLHGDFINYHKNGNVNDKKYYVMGKADGTWLSFYKSGQKSHSTTYDNDVPHGKKLFFDDKGNLQLIRFYDYGRLIGYSYLGKNSEELPMTPIINETAKITSFYDNGKISRELEYKNGDLIGSYNEYYYSGILKSKMSYKDNEYDGAVIDYYPNGNKKAVANYQDGELQGPVKKFHDNGTIKEESNYINHAKSGSHKYFDTKGKLEKEEFYFNGEIYKSQTY